MEKRELTCRVEQTGFYFVWDPGRNLHTGPDLVEPTWKKNKATVNVSVVITQRSVSPERTISAWSRTSG